jgi:glycosyltransferase involved in cell wall biosynthesis
MLRSGLLPRDVSVLEALECSTHFTPGDRTAARHALGVYGDPCIVWVGRLAAGKDPLTVLEAFRLVVDELPAARLWCAFGDAPQLGLVRAFLCADERIRARVRLLGNLPHDRIELLLRAADIFVAGSLHESTGYALVEALACGVPPVISDIPAFRALTRDGAVGALFPPGDAVAAAAAICELAHSAPPRESIREHFERHASPEAVGRALRQAYASQIVRATAVTPIRVRRSPPIAAPARRRLRVCLVVPGGVDRSGTQRVIPCVLALIERLARDVDLHVLATRQEAEAAEYDLLGARVHCVPAGSRTAAVRWLLATNRRKPWDVLHALWMHPQGTAATLAAMVTRTPVLLHVNGGDLAALRDIRFGGRASFTGRTRLRLAVAGADRVTVPSELLAQRARELGFATERLTLGVPLDRWPPAAPRPRSADEPLRLLSVATLNPVKDHAGLLHALAELRRRGVDAQLSCVGEDLMHGALERLAAQLGITPHVHFHGFLPHPQLRPFFDAAHALVVSSRYEADPIVALEAAIAGNAVVGTAVGHLREWAPEAAAVCDPGDSVALAGILARMAHDDAERLRLAHAGQARALRLDADSAAARVLELYQEMAHV